MTNDDDSFDEESEDEDDLESSDEYEPPSAKKKRITSPRDDDRSTGMERLDSECGTGERNAEENRNGEERTADHIPSSDHIPCETIFAINRTTYRPRWRSQTPSDREDSSTRQTTSTLPPVPVQIKAEPADDYEYQSSASRASSVPPPATNVPVTEGRPEFPVRAPVSLGSANQRQFYCVYCGLTSKWNRRDVRLHVMHVHMGVRAYSCGHCGFGNSRNRTVVSSHCSKSHPGRKMLIVDNEPLFEAIDSVQEQDNQVMIALTTTEGTPLLTLQEVDDYLTAKGIRFRAPGVGRKTAEPKVAPDPETLRNLFGGQTQPQEFQQNMADTPRASSNSSELLLSKDQMEEFNCQWKCRQCDFRDPGFVQVEIHIVRHHLQLELFSCPHCRKYFSESVAALAHIDENHAGSERQVVSTVDEKSKYIRRNIECTSVDVEPSTINLQTEFQTEHTSPVQTQSDDARQDESNSKESELENDNTGVPQEATSANFGNSVQDPEQTESSRAQTDEYSSMVKTSAIEESPPSLNSDNACSSTQEGRDICDSVLPALSCSSPAPENESTNGESVQSVSKVSEETGESFESNHINTCQDPTRNDVVLENSSLGNADQMSAEEQVLPEDPENSEDSSSNRSVPTSTLEITRNEAEGDNEQTGYLEAVHAEEQYSFKDSSQNHHSTVALVPSLIASSNITNEENNDAIPGLPNKQFSPKDLSHTSKNIRPFYDTSEPTTNPNTITEKGNSDLHINSHTERENSDGLPMPREEQSSFKDSSPTIGLSQQSSFTEESPATSGSNTGKPYSTICQNVCAEEINVLVTSEKESAKSPPEEHAEQLDNFTLLQMHMELETVQEKRTDSHEESCHPPPDKILAINLSTDVVQKVRPLNVVDDDAETRKEFSAGQVIAANLPKRDVEPLSDAPSAPSNISEEQKPGRDSTKGKTPSDSAELNPEDNRPDSHFVSASRSSSTGGRTPSGRLSEDDELSSGSSSLEEGQKEETSMWKCDDCSFATTSESLLVAHRRSRQQYRCVYCTDFLHSSVVHLRHHCFTRHPGKPISYKHTIIPCSEVKKSSPAPHNNSNKVTTTSGQGKNTEIAAQHQKETKPTTITSTSSKKVISSPSLGKNTHIVSQPQKAKSPIQKTDTVIKTPTANTYTERKSEPINLEPDDFGYENSYSNQVEGMDFDESEISSESDNSADEDWDEPVSKKKKKSKMAKKLYVPVAKVSKETPKDDSIPSAAGQQAGDIVCDLCNSYSTPNCTVIRHHVMSHLQYYPYFCPYCVVFRSVRSFPIIKHIRKKHEGKPERFECSLDQNMEKKVRKSYHRIKSNQKHHVTPVLDEIQDTPPLPHQLPPPAPVDTKVVSKPESDECDEVAIAAVPIGASKTRRILYKCKFCGLKTHLRGDFRHHIMRELQYKPFK